MKISKLRADIYNLLDRVLDTGIPLEVERRGQILTIMPPAQGRTKLERLIHRPNCLVGSPDDFISVDWSDSWAPGKNI